MNDIKASELVVNGVIYVPKGSLVTPAPNVNGMTLAIVRSYASGVHFGYVGKREDLLAGLKVTLRNSRRVFYWDGAASLSQLATDGVTKAGAPNCKFSVVVPELEVMQVIEIIPVSSSAAEILNNLPVWKK